MSDAQTVELLIDDALRDHDDLLEVENQSAILENGEVTVIGSSFVLPESEEVDQRVDRSISEDSKHISVITVGENESQVKDSSDNEDRQPYAVNHVNEVTINDVSPKSGNTPKIKVNVNLQKGSGAISSQAVPSAKASELIIKPTPKPRKLPETVHEPNNKLLNNEQVTVNKSHRDEVNKSDSESVCTLDSTGSHGSSDKENKQSKSEAQVPIRKKNVSLYACLLSCRDGTSFLTFFLI